MRVALGHPCEPSLAVPVLRCSAQPQCRALGMKAKPKTFSQGLESVIVCNKSLASPEGSLRLFYNMPGTSSTSHVSKGRLKPVQQ